MSFVQLNFYTQEACLPEHPAGQCSVWDSQLSSTPVRRLFTPQCRVCFFAFGLEFGMAVWHQINSEGNKKIG